MNFCHSGTCPCGYLYNTATPVIQPHTQVQNLYVQIRPHNAVNLSTVYYSNVHFFLHLNTNWHCSMRPRNQYFLEKSAMFRLVTELTHHRACLMTLLASSCTPKYCYGCSPLFLQVNHLCNLAKRPVSSSGCSIEVTV